MKATKKFVSLLLAAVMVFSLFTVNSFAATIKKIEIVTMPVRTTFIKGDDWNYGYWKMPEDDGLGVFTEREDVISLMHQGGYPSRYADRGMLDMNGLVIKVTYSDGKTKNITYKETKHSNGVITQNIYFSAPKGLNEGENTIEIYLPENFDVYTTYKIKLLDLGDVNSDTKVNSSDALLVLQHSVQSITLTGDQVKLGDMNKDNKINSFDALMILQKSVGIA